MDAITIPAQITLPTDGVYFPDVTGASDDMGSSSDKWGQALETFQPRYYHDRGLDTKILWSNKVRYDQIKVGGGSLLRQEDWVGVVIGRVTVSYFPISDTRTPGGEARYMTTFSVARDEVERLNKKGAGITVT